MWERTWEILVLVCTVVGALTVWALITAPVFVWVLRRARTPQAPQPPAAADAHQARRATSWSQVPSWVKHDKEWAAAVVLLGSDAIADRTTPFVDFPARRIDWLGLRMQAATWPTRDKLLVEVAYDLAYGQHEAGDPLDGVPHLPVTVADLAEGLDEPHFDLVHHAVNLRRGG